MPAIFLSYRRSDSIDPAGRIFDRLTARFPRREVFKDVDSIPLSVPFPEFLRETLRATRVVLAIIGPQWLDCRDPDGGRRLDNPGDFVRIELETALELGLPTIPVTVSNAAMPPRERLPESLRGLADRHGRPVRPDPDFHADMDRLIEGLTELLGGDELAQPARIVRETLRELLDVAQKWHDEIVHAAAAIAFTDDEREMQRVEFLYVHTRKHLPRMASIREALEGVEEASALAAAVDGFLSVATLPADPLAGARLAVSLPDSLQSARPRTLSTTCDPGLLCRPAFDFFPLPRPTIRRPAVAVPGGSAAPAEHSLDALRGALQRISDEVMRLTAAGE